MTVIPDVKGLCEMCDGDLDAPEPALMAAGDLGLGPVYLKGVADQPEKLRESCRNAGIVDAHLGRERRTWLTENAQAGYNDGYDYEMGRQKRAPWAGPSPRLQSGIDVWVQRVREKLRRVTR